VGTIYKKTHIMTKPVAVVLLILGIISVAFGIMFTAKPDIVVNDKDEKTVTTVRYAGGVTPLVLGAILLVIAIILFIRGSSSPYKSL